MYADTDSYQVVWHGNYLRWFEEGRYSICKQAGINVAQMDCEGITFPIVDMHVRYKAPAKIYEEVVVETEITEVKSRTVKFSQTVKNKKSGVTLVTAEFVCVYVNTAEAKLQKMPNDVLAVFNDCLNN